MYADATQRDVEDPSGDNDLPDERHSFVQLDIESMSARDRRVDRRSEWPVLSSDCKVAGVNLLVV